MPTRSVGMSKTRHYRQLGALALHFMSSVLVGVSHRETPLLSGGRTLRVCCRGVGCHAHAQRGHAGELHVIGIGAPRSCTYGFDAGRCFMRLWHVRMPTLRVGMAPGVGLPENSTLSESGRPVVVLYGCDAGWCFMRLWYVCMPTLRVGMAPGANNMRPPWARQ